MNTYEEDEQQCDLIREENQILLDAFEAWILAKGLAQSTARKYREDIDFYINEFLLYESPTPASEGVDEVGMFLGYWFIRKAMWASAASIQSNARSLKKFYEFMMERGEVSPEAVTAMQQRIKEDLPEWVAGRKHPYFLRPVDDGLFLLAGIWDHWQGDDGAVIESCAIITTEANAQIRLIHERMPVILTQENLPTWIDPGFDQHTLLAMLTPYAAPMVIHPVSSKVNNPRHNGPDCVARISAEV